jgi:hypothetical protein
MFFQLSWQLPDGTDRQFVLGMPFEPLTNAVTSAVVAARDLCEPANLHRALGYAKPWLPVLADIAGVGFVGQVALNAAVSLAHRALGGELEPAAQPELTGAQHAAPASAAS